MSRGLAIAVPGSRSVDVSTCALDGHCGAMVAPPLKHPEGSPGRDPDGFPGKVTNAARPAWLIEMSDDQVIESRWAAKV